MKTERTNKPYNKNNKEKEEEKDGLSKKAKRVKDPIRCPFCFKTLLIPRDSYPEEQMAARIEKCVQAQTDSPCGMVMRSADNQSVASVILKRTTRPAPKTYHSAPKTYRSS